MVLGLGKVEHAGTSLDLCGLILHLSLVPHTDLLERDGTVGLGIDASSAPETVEHVFLRQLGVELGKCILTSFANSIILSWQRAEQVLQQLDRGMPRVEVASEILDNVRWQLELRLAGQRTFEECLNDVGSLAHLSQVVLAGKHADECTRNVVVILPAHRSPSSRERTRPRSDVTNPDPCREARESTKSSRQPEGS